MRQINYENKAIQRSTYMINGVRYLVDHKALMALRYEGEQMCKEFKDSDELNQWLRWNNAKATT